MNDTIVLTGAAMLETMWENRNKDLLDLITPFVLYAVSKKTAPGEKIDIEYTVNYVRENYGYKDIPPSAIKKILNRNPEKCIKKDKKNYFLLASLDSYTNEIDRRRAECEERIKNIGEQLALYLKSHCVRKRDYTSKEAIAGLHSFFSHYGLYLGTERLEQQEKLTPKEHEIDYYISRYIFEKKASNSIEYKYIIDLVKGYFLKTAIYLQPENGNLTSANYSNVEFYYDTPILLNLLGYQSEEEEKAAKELHAMLKSQKGKCHFFPHAETEMVSILSAYQRMLTTGEHARRTLEGLDRKKYTASSVERIKSSWKKTLETMFGITQKDIPAYSVKEDGSVDEKLVLDETELKAAVREKTKHYAEDNLQRDIESLLAIHRIRNNCPCLEIESSKAVFVTNNYDLTVAWNKYYKSKVDAKVFPIIITLPELAAIAWIKSGSVDNLPESQLLTNAYAALQPIPELLEKFSIVLDQMQYEGRITADEAAALRTNHYVKRELWEKTFGDENAANEQTVLEIKAKYDEGVLSDYKQKEKKRKDALYENAEIEAVKVGKVRKEFVLNKLRMISKIITIFLVLICLYATIKTWGNFSLNVFFAIVILVTLVSLYDVWKSREKFWDAVLVRIANQYETHVVEKKKKEYLSLLSHDKE